uniref:MRPL25 domain-containing protein n=1 Tax=Tetraselmis sp. GSL018 TaxID=582737 RepID=A0A061R0U9_9CHLO|mmetsp:Transcript_42582/g.101108  ORF Transcript_42582/g.101108 Transcript_42582/m.101108 type:complete len:123 (+) Transcript_42582:65-433(+)
MASRRLLQKLGEAALQPTFVNGKWRKPAISAKNVARLRKEDLLAGKEWPYEKPRSDPPYKQPKGHKRHKELEQRAKKVEEKLASMDDKIAQYRESVRIKDVLPFDQIMLTPKQIRQKMKSKT